MRHVAYAKRSVIIILIRKFFYFSFLVWKKINQKVFFIDKDRHLKKVLFVSSEKSPSEIGNQLNRIMWGFPFKKNLEITFLNSSIKANLQSGDMLCPLSQHNYISSRDHIRLLNKINLIKYFSYDLILVSSYTKWQLLVLPFIAGKVRLAGSNLFSYSEGIIWMKKYFYTHNRKQRNYYRDISSRNFANLVSRKNMVKKTYCFLTGPSFSDFKNFSYETGSVKIICNSIVKNNEFLDYIGGPDVITFADCVFHFGPSKYAHTFREKVMKVVNKYDSYIVVPDLTVPLLLNYYPDLKDRIIGLGISSSYNFPTKENLNVFGTESIATLFMLPLASSLADKIYFIGADGRQSSENYWWKHNSSVQFSDLMETVFETHPSFFRDRVYSSDYKNHCNIFKKLVEYGESMNKNYYSLTQSFIPVLSSRILDR